MNEEILVLPKRLKDGIYIEFWFNINTPCVSEITYFDKNVRKEIEKQFKDMIGKHNLDFTSESCFLVDEPGKGKSLVICLMGNDTEELCRDLEQCGFEVEEQP